jgi:hypothetical protein
VDNNKIDDDKNAGKLLVISFTMRMWCYDVGRITQWSTSRALLEATRCRHWASACIALLQRPPWSTILL